jgi:hypothetical protein
VCGSFVVQLTGASSSIAYYGACLCYHVCSAICLIAYLRSCFLFADVLVNLAVWLFSCLVLWLFRCLLFDCLIVSLFCCLVGLV